MPLPRIYARGVSMLGSCRQDGEPTEPVALPDHGRITGADKREELESAASSPEEWRRCRPRTGMAQDHVDHRHHLDVEGAGPRDRLDDTDREDRRSLQD